MEEGQPGKGRFGRVTGPCMCSPQAVQAWRWISAAGSTTFSLWPFFVTFTLSEGNTDTIENVAPADFQHFVQPQT